MDTPQNMLMPFIQAEIQRERERCAGILDERAAKADSLALRSETEPARTVWRHRALENRQSADAIRLPRESGAQPPAPAAAPALSEERVRDLDRQFVALLRVSKDINDRLAVLESAPRVDVQQVRTLLDEVPAIVQKVFGEMEQKQRAVVRTEIERYIDEMAPKPKPPCKTCGGSGMISKSGGTPPMAWASFGQCPDCPPPTVLWNTAPPPADSGKTGGEIAQLCEWLRESTAVSELDQRCNRWAAAVEALQAENARLRHNEHDARMTIGELKANDVRQCDRIAALEFERDDALVKAGVARSSAHEFQKERDVAREEKAHWMEQCSNACTENARLRGWHLAMRAAWKFCSDERGSYPTAALRGDPVPDGRL